MENRLLEPLFQPKVWQVLFWSRPFCLPLVCWCFLLLWNWSLSQSTFITCNHFMTKKPPSAATDARRMRHAEILSDLAFASFRRRAAMVRFTFGSVQKKLMACLFSWQNWHLAFSLLRRHSSMNMHKMKREFFLAKRSEDFCSNSWGFVACLEPCDFCSSLSSRLAACTRASKCLTRKLTWDVKVLSWSIQHLQISNKFYFITHTFSLHFDLLLGLWPKFGLVNRPVGSPLCSVQSFHFHLRIVGGGLGRRLRLAPGLTRWTPSEFSVANFFFGKTIGLKKMKPTMFDDILLFVVEFLKWSPRFVCLRDVAKLHSFFFLDLSFWTNRLRFEVKQRILKH